MPKYRLQGSEVWLYEVTADTKEEAVAKVADSPYQYRESILDTANIEVVEELPTEEQKPVWHRFINS